MLDVAVKVHKKTLPLFKVFYESYRYHFKPDGQFLLIAEEDCFYELKSLPLKANVQILKTQDFLPNFSDYPGYQVQMYIKLRICELVKTSHHLIIDDDFVFIRPTDERNYFWEGKSFWFYEDWKGIGNAIKWKEPSRQFLGFEPPYSFITNSTYVMDTKVSKQLGNDYDLKRCLTLENFSEFHTYGAYAYEKFRDQHNWVHNFLGDEVLNSRINQPPPHYLTLDPLSDLKQYGQFNSVAFWSHWGRCEEKMREFFEASR